MNRLDSFSEMEAWGFSSTRCGCCGIHYTEISGVMIQCAKCKLTSYCSMKCFNADLQNHMQFCKTGSLDKGVQFKRKDDPAEHEAKEDDVTKPAKREEDDASCSTAQTAGMTSCNDTVSDQSLLNSSQTDNDASASSFANDDLPEGEASHTASRRISNLEILEEEEEIDIREEDTKAEAAEAQQHMLVLEVQEVEDEEDEVHPLYLFLDAEEVQEADTVIWLMKDSDEYFSVIRTDQDEEIEIVRSGGGTATILEDEELALSDDEEGSDHYLTMDLPSAERPASKHLQQEAVSLYATEMEKLSASGRSPSWAGRCSLRSVNTNAQKERHASMSSVPCWVSSRSLKSTKTANDDTKKQATKQNVPEWIANRPLRSAAELWTEAEQDGDCKVRLYRRVGTSGGDAQATSLGHVPDNVKNGSVLFCRVPLKPVGTRPVAADEPSSTGSSDPSSRGLSSSSHHGRPWKQQQQSNRSPSISDSLRSSTHGKADPLDGSDHKPSWALKNTLRSTGRRASLTLNFDQFKGARQNSVNLHVPWQQQRGLSKRAESAALSFSSKN